MHIKKLLVSLSSHLPRIETTHKAIESILNSTMLPEKIVLFLSEQDFPTREIPRSLSRLQSIGLSIIFIKENFKVATKLLPALKMFPDYTIITIDDDRIYDPRMIECLWKAHQLHPNNIISPSARKYNIRGKGPHSIVTHLVDRVRTNLDLVDHGIIDILGREVKYIYGYLAHILCSLLYDTEEFGIFEGFSGVLYPPNSLDQDVHDFDLFCKLTPYADDIWYQVMAMKKGTKVRGLPKEINDSLHIPKDIEGTQDCGLFHKHLPANDYMLYNAVNYFNLFDVSGIPKINNPRCNICKRPVILFSKETRSESLPKESPRSNKKCPGCFNPNPKKILCIGAYDYGNIGDKCYKKVLHHYLTRKLANCKYSYKLYFSPDTVRINTNGDYIDHDSNDQDIDFDFLIIGGGGILCDYPNFSAIKYYCDRAIKYDKPYIFMSVGLQTRIQNPKIYQARNILGNAVTLINNASLVFVRSQTDLSILNSICRGNIHFSRDLGYLVYNLYTSKYSSPKYITLIQTGSVNINNEHIVNKIHTSLEQYNCNKLVVMNFGGLEEPLNSKDFVEWDLFDKSLFESKFPGIKIKIYMGDSISDKLKNSRYPNDNIRKSDLNLKKALKIIEKSHLVITGRYHGKIFADALNVKNESPCFTYKLIAENKMSLLSASPNQLCMSAMMQLDMTAAFIKNYSGLHKPVALWNEEDRNTSIVNINKADPSLPISHLQAMSNELLHEYTTLGEFFTIK